MDRSELLVGGSHILRRLDPTAVHRTARPMAAASTEVSPVATTLVHRSLSIPSLPSCPVLSIPPFGLPRIENMKQNAEFIGAELWRERILCGTQGFRGRPRDIVRVKRLVMENERQSTWRCLSRIRNHKSKGLRPDQAYRRGYALDPTDSGREAA